MAPEVRREPPLLRRETQRPRLGASHIRLVPVLVAMATGPDGPHVRAMAVAMLAFAPCPASVSLPVLRRAVAEDEDLGVRIAARHAIHTVEHAIRRAKASNP